MSNIYSLEEDQLPGNWNYRGDYVWRNSRAEEILTVKEGTMRETDDREDCYQVNIHKDSGVETILDNISRDRAEEVAELYITAGEIPEESWMHDGGDNP